MSDRRGFCHAIALADKDSSECCEPARKLWRQRCGSRLHPANAVLAWKLSGLGALAKSVQCRRDQGYHRGLLFHQQSSHLLYVEPRSEDEGRAEDQRGIEQHIQPIDVVEGQAAQDCVPGIDFGGIWPKQLIDICHQVVVRQHYAFWHSRRSAGVGKYCQSLIGRLVKLREAV